MKKEQSMSEEQGNRKCEVYRRWRWWKDKWENGMTREIEGKKTWGGKREIQAWKIRKTWKRVREACFWEGMKYRDEADSQRLPCIPSFNESSNKVTMFVRAGWRDGNGAGWSRSRLVQGNRTRTGSEGGWRREGGVMSLNIRLEIKEVRRAR